MFSRFFPKEVNFFDLFEKQVDCAVKAAKELKEIVCTPGLLQEEAYNKIGAMEHEGDDIAHTIMDQLNKTFITPFDREGIHALTKKIDDITDMVNTIVSRLRVYKIQGGDKYFIEFASMIETSVFHVASAVKGLRDTKNAKAILTSCIEINRLERQGDIMRDKVFVELFENAKDPIQVIKWKEIYEDAETLLDICEDVAHVVESILVKHL
jgi:predicted phosphate transport protein (TIGR00153 family)